MAVILLEGIAVQLRKTGGRPRPGVPPADEIRPLKIRVIACCDWRKVLGEMGILQLRHSEDLAM